MKHVSWMKWGAPLILAAAMGATGAQAADQSNPSQYGPGYGPGMMGGGGGYGYGYGMGRGGYGPGMRYGDEGGYGGYGQGMGGRGWGGYGMGSGMMGGYGMGPGMMGGYGMGSGWGGGMGSGMMGLGPIWSLNLNDNQRRAVDNILNEQHRLHWSMMSSLFIDYGKLGDLYDAEHLDAAAIGKVYDDIFKAQRAMIESGIKTRNRIYDQLTKEQREQLRRDRWSGRWGR